MPMFNPASLQSAQNVLFRREKKDEIAPSISAAYRKRMLDDPRYGRIASLEEGAMNHIPNSGWAGAAAQMFNGYMAGKEKKALESDYLGEQQRTSDAYKSLLSGDDVDPTVRQLSQSGVPDLEEFAVTAHLKSRLEGRKRNVQIIDGPDGKYEIDLDKPDAQPRKVLDAKPAERKTSKVEMVGSQGPGNYLIYDDTGEEVRKVGGIYDKGPSTVINMDNGQGAWTKEDAKLWAQTHAETVKMARQAPNQVALYNEFEKVLEKTPAGPIESLSLPLRSALGSMGWKDKNVPSQEQLRSMTNQFVLGKVDELGGTQISNADITFLKAIPPSLANTPGGNKLILEIGRRTEKRKMDIAKLEQQYIAQNGRLDSGFISYSQDWAEKNPLFDDELRRRLSAASGPPAAGGGAKRPAVRNIIVE